MPPTVDEFRANYPKQVRQLTLVLLLGAKILSWASLLHRGHQMDSQEHRSLNLYAFRLDLTDVQGTELLP